MKSLFLLLFICPLLLQAQGQDTLYQTIETPSYRIYYQENDPSVDSIQTYVETGLQHIAHFLRKNFPEQIDIYLFPNRTLLDKQWQKAWGMPSFSSECWMVGSGVEGRLDLLSPSIWHSQACEHDPDNHTAIKQLVHHELVHILHSAYNRSPSFEDIHNMDWFVEGLAVYASGQLDDERLTRTINYVKQTSGPEQLSLFWKGANKYGLSGSLVAYLDQHYGRDMLANLMEHNDVNDVLEELKIDEKTLVRQWKAALLLKK